MRTQNAMYLMICVFVSGDSNRTAKITITKNTSIGPNFRKPDARIAFIPSLDTHLASRSGYEKDKHIRSARATGSAMVPTAIGAKQDI
jgi:hypothetical protein